jgi:hypothetical protein
VIAAKGARLPTMVADRARELEVLALDQPSLVKHEVVRRLRDDTNHMPQVWRELRRHAAASLVWPTTLQFGGDSAVSVYLSILQTDPKLAVNGFPKEPKRPPAHSAAECRDAAFANVFQAAAFFGSHTRAMLKRHPHPDALKWEKRAKMLFAEAEECRREGNTDLADRLHNRAFDLQWKVDNPIGPDGWEFVEDGRGDLEARYFCRAMANLMLRLFNKRMYTTVAHLASTALGREVQRSAVREWCRIKTEREDGASKRAVA